MPNIFNKFLIVFYQLLLANNLFPFSKFSIASKWLRMSLETTKLYSFPGHNNCIEATCWFLPINLCNYRLFIVVRSLSFYPLRIQVCPCLVIVILRSSKFHIISPNVDKHRIPNIWSWLLKGLIKASIINCKPCTFHSSSLQTIACKWVGYSYYPWVPAH